MPPDVLLRILLADIVGAQYGCATIGEVRSRNLTQLQSPQSLIYAMHIRTGIVKAFGDTSFVNLSSTDSFRLSSRPVSILPGKVAPKKQIFTLFIRDNFQCYGSCSEVAL
jgi:hypothetical protein